VFFQVLTVIPFYGDPMSSQPSLFENQAVLVSYSPGFIVLSYIVSLIGCTTTLELLHRRTSKTGWYNWCAKPFLFYILEHEMELTDTIRRYLLISASITMGAIGIWCMHYIGNRAVILKMNGLSSNISYSSGFTAISIFLPISVLMLAFYFIGITEHLNLVFICLAGSLTGVAICGMHYVGQLGINNYNLHYSIPHVVGAVIIAIVASIIALSLFFLLRAFWTDSWWKRCFSAIILAAAVSGMHWTATVGTLYSSKGVRQLPGGLSPKSVVIVCTLLVSSSFILNQISQEIVKETDRFKSALTCALLLIFAVIAKRRSTKFADRAHQLVLACTFFDPDGRVMVTPDGLLPNRKIIDRYIERVSAPST
jgi:NO-binding membrane sensor protein with MHYT domain